MKFRPTPSDKTIRDSIFNCSASELEERRRQAYDELSRQLSDPNSSLWKALGGCPSVTSKEELYAPGFVFALLTIADRTIPQFAEIRYPADPTLARSAEILARYGWWLLPDFTVNFCYEIVEKESELTPEAITKAILAYANDNESEVIASKVSEWSDSAFSRRDHIFQDALWAHREGKYTLSVPALLPHIEGIIREKLKEKLDLYKWQFDPVYDKFSEKVAPLLMLPPREHECYSWDEARAVESYAPLLAIGSLYDRFDPCGEYNGSDLNRNALCHGRWLSYHTLENSTRLFLLLDALHDLMGKAWPV